MIKTKRIYERPETEDGYRVLVDRLWPRGLSRARARIDEWLKDAGPSDDLRRWFHAHPDRWEEFRMRYREELIGRGSLLDKIAARSKNSRVTLLYSYRDATHNHAAVIKEYLEERKGRNRASAGRGGSALSVPLQAGCISLVEPELHPLDEG